MSMGSRKVNTEGIDEELLLASIGRRTQDGTLRPAQEVPAAAPTEEDTAAPEPSPVQPVTREKAQRESGRRKRQDEDYNELFLRRNEIKTRQCVYISRDVHGKILRIVNDIAGGEISVGGYVDTVLRQHLEQQQDCGGMFTQVQASVEILSPVPVSGKCSEKDYERLFIRDPEVKAREGKMAYVRPEYHERIMRITRVIGHDRLTLSAYIDHVLTHHFNQCEDAIKSLYARNYNSVF